jgi:hypothetical protein
MLKSWLGETMTNKQDVFIGGKTFGPLLNWFMRMSGLSRLLLWLVFDYKGRLPGFVVRLGPWLFGLAIGRKPHRVANDTDELPED